MTLLKAQRVIGVAGFKNSGKTTLVEKLVKELTAQGFRISTVKHAHHSFDLDVEGKDSFRHRVAGATEVAVISQQRWAIMHELRSEEPPSLQEMLAKLAPCDLVIIEGYKRDAHDKIEVRNVTLGHPELAGDDPTVVAIAANGHVDHATVPVFDRDDVTRLVAFIVQHCGLHINRQSTHYAMRRARAADAQSIHALTQAAYAKWIPMIGRKPKPMTADTETAIAHHWIDLAHDESVLAGLVEMIPETNHLVIESLAVAEAYQGRGLGETLLSRAEAIAREAGYPEVRLYTNAAFTENLSYYLKRGYHEHARSALSDGGVMVHFSKKISP